MDTQVVEQNTETPPPDPFDSAVTSESTYVAPKAEPTRADDGTFSQESEEEPPPVAAKTDTPPPEKKPRNDPQARIDQAIARQREAERVADAERRRADEAERRAAPRAAPAPEPVKADKFPSFAQYLESHVDASLEDFMDDRDDWRDQRRETKAREERETTQAEQAFTSRATAFSDRYAKAVAADAELPTRIDQTLLTVRPYSTLTTADKALIRNIPDQRERDAVAFRCFLADQWVDSEHAVALLEHLSDPQQFQRLATLPPNQVIRELAKLEAGFSAAPNNSGPAREAKPASQARPPFKPLGTTSPVHADDDGSDDEPIEAHIRRENAKDRKAGRL